MKKLSDLVKVIENDKECVVLKIKDDSSMDLIKLGCFNGDEDTIIMTKGKDHLCSVIRKDLKNSTWSWGISGHTLVSLKLKKQGKLISECLNKDLGIDMGPDYWDFE